MKQRLHVPIVFLLVALVSLLLAPAPAAAATDTLSVPLLVDGQGGRLYAAVQRDAAAHHIGVYATRDGKLLATFPYPGPFALDAAGQRLFVMTAANQVTVLHSVTGQVLNAFTVGPAPANPQKPALLTAAPQYDPQTGRLLVFVGNTMHSVDAATGKLLKSQSFDMPVQDRCRILNGPLAISRTFFDADRGLVYLDFVTYSCIPWIGFTVVAYDLAKGIELSRQGSDGFSGLAAGSNFYALSWYRMGIGTVWTERDGKRAPSAPGSTGWSAGGPFQLDAARQRLYQGSNGAIRIFNPADMTLTAVIPQPVRGTLAAYDPVTDQVYFVDGATVRPWPAAKLKPAAAAPVKVQTLPREPVDEIFPSPNWGKDKTVFARWSQSQVMACYVFQQGGGNLLRSTDGGKGWISGPVRLGGRTPLGWDCALISALAVSPTFAQDRTLLVGVVGNGIFKSTDGGLNWTPAGKGLPHMGVTALALSPAFAADRTAFAAVLENGLQRSTDGGATWQTLKTPTNGVFALSPEFDRDRTLAVAGTVQGSGSITPVLQLSEDRGATWRTLAAPSGERLKLLSLAPVFARWRVLFAGDANGDLFRSADAGQSWQRVLQGPAGGGAAAGLDRMQLVYGPHEERREVFLLTTGYRYEADRRVAWGRLHRSPDGGQTWAEMSAGQGITPTALAISPAYAQDGVLFIGTAAGEILHIRPGVLQ